MRCAKTEPTSVAVVPFRPGRRRAEHRDTRELADPAGQHRVREEPDRERREDEREARVRRRGSTA